MEMADSVREICSGAWEDGDCIDGEVWREVRSRRDRWMKRSMEVEEAGREEVRNMSKSSRL